MSEVSRRKAFLSIMLLLKKKYGSNTSIVNLESLNQFIPYNYFRMESLLSIENIVKKDKLDLQGTYSRKYARFYFQGNLYKFLFPCFGLAPGPYIFTKPLKVPLVFFRRLGNLIIIYLDGMLNIGKSVEETLVYRDTVILLMQELGFVIN